MGTLRAEWLSQGALMAVQVLTGVLGGAGYAAAFRLLSIRLDSRRGPVVRAAASAGQRSLTVYLLNSVLVTAILHPQLGGAGPRLDSLGALCVGGTVWLVGVAVAARLERIGNRGPADTLMRRLVRRPS
ncbi:hypothetical protein GCM10028793_09360 [Nocardiopsis oceani]